MGYTIDYLDAKIAGDSQAMTDAQNAANALRAQSKRYKYSGFGDEFSNYMNTFIAAGFAAANESGYVYGSDEYAIVATTAISTYVNRYREIDFEHQMRLL